MMSIDLHMKDKGVFRIYLADKVGLMTIEAQDHT